MASKSSLLRASAPWLCNNTPLQDLPRLWGRPIPKGSPVLPDVERLLDGISVSYEPGEDGVAVLRSKFDLAESKVSLESRLVLPGGCSPAEFARLHFSDLTRGVTSDCLKVINDLAELEGERVELQRLNGKARTKLDEATAKLAKVQQDTTEARENLAAICDESHRKLDEYDLAKDNALSFLEHLRHEGDLMSIEVEKTREQLAQLAATRDQARDLIDDLSIVLFDSPSSPGTLKNTEGHPVAIRVGDKEALWGSIEISGFVPAAAGSLPGLAVSDTVSHSEAASDPSKFLDELLERTGFSAPSYERSQFFKGLLDIYTPRLVISTPKQPRIYGARNGDIYGLPGVTGPAVCQLSQG
jgi:hypothetical protein